MKILPKKQSGCSKSHNPIHINYLPSFLIQLARDRRHLQLADRHRDLDLARAGHGTVEGCMAARQAGGLGHDLEPVCGVLVTAVEDEPMRVHQRCRAEVIIAGPEGWAGSSAGRAQNALGGIVETGPVFGRLDTLPAVFGDRAFIDEPGQNLLVIVEEGFHIHDQVFDDP